MRGQRIRVGPRIARREANGGAEGRWPGAARERPANTDMAVAGDAGHGGEHGRSRHRSGSPKGSSGSAAGRLGPRRSPRLRRSLRGVVRIRFRDRGHQRPTGCCCHLRVGDPFRRTARRRRHGRRGVRLSSRHRRERSTRRCGGTMAPMMPRLGSVEGPRRRSSLPRKPTRQQHGRAMRPRHCRRRPIQHRHRRRVPSTGRRRLRRR